MPLRHLFPMDWARGIRGALENIVRENFPSQVRLWPILQTFDFEGYFVGEDYFVMIMKDKLSGIMAGPGILRPFPFTDHPPVPLSPENVDAWLFYLVEKFSLRNEDVAMVLPIHDSGLSNPSTDFELFSEQEKELWNRQLAFNIARQEMVVPNPAQVSQQGTTIGTLNL
jgi:hypothetical protein